MTWKLIATSITALAAVGGFFGYWWPFGKGPESLLLHGTVETQEVRLSSKVGGRVERVAVAEGELVEAGQPLIYLEAPELRLQRDQLQARLDAAEAQLAKAEKGARDEEKEAARAAVVAAEARWQRLKAGYRNEEVEHARQELASVEAEVDRAARELERERYLIRDGASSQAQYDAALATYGRLQGLTRAARARYTMLQSGSRSEEIAEAAAELERARAQHQLLLAGTRSEEIAEARARVAELRAMLAEMDVHLAEAVVLAPERAVVEVVGVRKGTTVAPNQPMVRVLRADDLWVKAYVPEVELGKLQLNQPVEVTVDSYPGRRFRGTIDHIASISEFTPRNVQSADERRHQVFAIKVRVDDPQGVFKSGMAADVHVVVE